MKMLHQGLYATLTHPYHGNIIKNVLYMYYTLREMDKWTVMGRKNYTVFIIRYQASVLWLT